MDDRSWWLLLPAPIRRLPADLAAVLGVVVLTVLAVFVPGVNDTPVRVVLGLPFVLFLPGYAFIAALFPEAGEPPTASEEGSPTASEEGSPTASEEGSPTASEGEPSASDRGPEMGDRGIDGIERVALSFGLSIAITPLVGLVLNFTPWGIRLVPIVVSLSGFTVVATAVAAQRRWELPEGERFRVPYREWLAAAREELFEPETRADAALNVLLALSIVVAMASVGYALFVPKQGESFTEFYVLTENESGELVAADYPTEFERGESREVVLGISNQEHARTTYTVVVELHRVEFVPGPNNSTRIRVLEEEQLRRFRTTLAHNETWIQPYNVTPTMTGRNLRLTFLLYRGDPPAEPTVDNAYRELHLWVNVTAPS